MKKLIIILLILSNLIVGGLYYFLNTIKHTEITNNLAKFKYTDVKFNYDTPVFEASRKKYFVDKFVKDKISGLTIEQQIGQLFFVELQTKPNLEQDKDFITKTFPSGVYFGPNNILSEADLKSDSDHIQSWLGGTNAFLSTDEEGATIVRLWWDKSLAGPYYINKSNTEVISYYYGNTRTKAFIASGLNMNFAPVVDLVYNGGYDANRSISFDAGQVAKLSKQIVKGQQDGGVLSVIKYFPGTGSAKGDPKNSDQEIQLDKSNLLSEDLIPFKENADTTAVIMTSHAKFPKLDTENRVTYSSKIVTDILRKDLNFKGLVITDDLNSKTTTEDDKYVKAILAGHDLLYTSASYSDVQKGIDSIKTAVDAGTITQSRIQESLERIYNMKLKYGLMKM